MARLVDYGGSLTKLMRRSRKPRSIPIEGSRIKVGWTALADPPPALQVGRLAIQCTQALKVVKQTKSLDRSSDR